MLLTSNKSQRHNFILELQKINQFEQTLIVAECLKQFSFSPLKFIKTVCDERLEQNTNLSNSLRNDSLEASLIFEEQANDLSYFQVLKDKPVEKKLKMLLSYLPLLSVSQRNNDLKNDLKKLYYTLIIDLLSNTSESNSFLSECYYLSKMAYFHPIFDSDQKKEFQKWYEKFEIASEAKPTKDQQTIYNSYPSYTSQDSEREYLMSINNSSLSLPDKDPLTKSDDRLNEEIAFEENQYTSLWHQQADSLVGEYKPLEGKKQAPIGQEKKDFEQIRLNDKNLLSSSKNFTSIIDAKESNIGLNGSKIDFSTFSRSNFYSLPLQNNSTSQFLSSYNRGNEHEASENFMLQFRGVHSNTNTYQNNLIPNNNFKNDLNSSNTFVKCSPSSFTETGMKNVPYWLKYLRLHKYTNLFSNLTYDQMINLTDEDLMKLNVTLGARKKILYSIDKLKTRGELLKQFIKLLDEYESKKENTVDIDKILDELTEISMSPLLPENSQPTSLAVLKSLKIEDFNGLGQSIENEKESSEGLNKLIVDLLDRIQKYILNEKSGILGNEEKLNDVVMKFIAIIDRLFRTKAFSDIKQTQMAKLRASFFEKNPALYKLRKQQQLAMNQTRIAEMSGNQLQSSQSFDQTQIQVQQKAASYQTQPPAYYLNIKSNLKSSYPYPYQYSNNTINKKTT